MRGDAASSELALGPLSSDTVMSLGEVVRLVLHTGEVVVPQTTEMEELRRLLAKKPTLFLERAGGRMPNFPEALGYVSQRGDFWPFVLFTLEAMRLARCTAGDVALVKIYQDRAFLQHLQKLEDETDYDEAADFFAALHGRRTERMWRVPVDGHMSADAIVYRKRGLQETRNEHVVVPVTRRLLESVLSHLPADGDFARGGPKHRLVDAGPSTTVPGDRWRVLAGFARELRSLYRPGSEFPAWSIDMLACGSLASYMLSVVVYYPKNESLDRVKDMAREREPVHIAMERHYDLHRLHDYFGYKHGAYRRSTKFNLMPQIAIYCRTPFRRDLRMPPADVHVINVTGLAFDSENQPDYKYYFPLTKGKKEELVRRMKMTWRMIFSCARRRQFRRVYLCNVGGGSMARFLDRSDFPYEALKKLSLAPVEAEYPDIRVHPLSEIVDGIHGNEPRLSDGLLVNAWDPWSLVGNGNAADDSLNARFGRATAMALLTWPITNPDILYEGV